MRLAHMEQDCWQGSFGDYLELVKRRPAVARTAHARLYDMICRHGWEEQNGLRHYKFFSRALFGLARPLCQLVEEYLRPAAMGLPVRNRILLLVGPVASGKSTIAQLCKQGLEEYSRTDEGALYGLSGCPLHEEPLHLIPAVQRPTYRQLLGVPIEGDLCPVCRDRLRREFAGKIADFPVERVFISEADRVGIGTFQPQDPKSQDIAELTGSVDLAALTQFGVESDPRAFRFDGEINAANRGILEMQEMLKCDERFLWQLLSLAQEGLVKTARFALISHDEVIIAHSNDEEFRAFVANRRQRALLSRLMVVQVPYPLQVSEEVRIYRSLLGQSTRPTPHQSPGALRTAAAFAVLSRLDASGRQSVDLLAELRKIQDSPAANASALGMSGADPRLVMNCLCAAVARPGVNCVDAALLNEVMSARLSTDLALPPKVRERWLELLALAGQEAAAWERRDAGLATTEALPDAAESVLRQYLASVAFYCQNGTPAQAAAAPDETLMRLVEGALGIGEASKLVFRQELAYALHPGSPDLSQLGRYDQTLRQAIGLYLLAQSPAELPYSGTPLEEWPATPAAVARRLISHYHYCSECAYNLLITYWGRASS